jgi:hypothetical protein
MNYLQNDSFPNIPQSDTECTPPEIIENQWTKKKTVSTTLQSKTSQNHRFARSSWPEGLILKSQSLSIPVSPNITLSNERYPTFRLYDPIRAYPSRKVLDYRFSKSWSRTCSPQIFVSNVCLKTTKTISNFVTMAQNFLSKSILIEFNSHNPNHRVIFRLNSRKLLKNHPECPSSWTPSMAWSARETT